VQLNLYITSLSYIGRALSLDVGLDVYKEVSSNDGLSAQIGDDTSAVGVKVSGDGHEAVVLGVQLDEADGTRGGGGSVQNGGDEGSRGGDIGGQIDLETELYISENGLFREERGATGGKCDLDVSQDTDGHLNIGLCLDVKNGCRCVDFSEDVSDGGDPSQQAGDGRQKSSLGGDVDGDGGSDVGVYKDVCGVDGRDGHSFAAQNTTEETVETVLISLAESGDAETVENSVSEDAVAESVHRHVAQKWRSLRVDCDKGADKE